MPAGCPGGQLYRGEVYRDGRFCGMVLLDFSGRREDSALQWRSLGRVRYAGVAAPVARLAGEPAGELGGR